MSAPRPPTLANGAVRQFALRTPSVCTVSAPPRGDGPPSTVGRVLRRRPRLGRTRPRPVPYSCGRRCRAVRRAARELVICTSVRDAYRGRCSGAAPTTARSVSSIRRTARATPASHHLVAARGPAPRRASSPRAPRAGPDPPSSPPRGAWLARATPRRSEPRPDRSPRRVGFLPAACCTSRASRARVRELRAAREHRGLIVGSAPIPGQRADELSPIASPPPMRRRRTNSALDVRQRAACCGASRPRRSATAGFCSPGFKSRLAGAVVFVAQLLSSTESSRHDLLAILFMLR